MVKDRYIDFINTNHDNPYNDKEFLELDDKIGYMMAYKYPFVHNRDIKYVKKLRKKLTNDICRKCKFFKGKIYTKDNKLVINNNSNYDKCKKCRVHILKHNFSKNIHICEEIVRDIDNLVDLIMEE